MIPVCPAVLLSPFLTNHHEMPGSCIMSLPLLITLGSKSKSKPQVDAHLRRRQQVRRAQMYDCCPQLGA